MLYKNDQPYKLDTKEIAAIEKHFHGKFPVRVVYPPNRVVPSKLKHNRLPDKPNSISFDYKAVVKTKTGTEIWRYAENIIVATGGEKRYMPKKFRYDGSVFLGREDIEKVYFLLRKSEYCFEGNNNNGLKVKFMFEDLVSEAEKKAAKEKINARINILIYGEDLGLSETRLREVAKAYHIKNVDDLTYPQVQIHIAQRVHATKDGADRFFDMVNADKEIEIRVSIQKAIDSKALVYDQQKKTWLWKTPEGHDPVKGGKVPPNKNAQETLYDLYNGDKGFRADLSAVLLAQNPNAGKGGDDIEDNSEEE